MKPSITVLLSFGTVAGCTAANDMADAIARERAKAAVNSVVEERFPSVEATPVTDCVIDNASASQITNLAADAVLGPTEKSVTVVRDVLSKGDTLTCLFENGLPVLAAGQL
jgi:predicted ThiF/HesA family dinucleotide-utilizing enzyme